MDLLQGTLDMLVLRTLLAGSLHGYGIAKSIRSTSNEALDIEFGSLYPALKRLEAKGWIASGWETSEHNRRAKFYKLTAAGPETTGAGTLQVGRLRERGRTDHGCVAGGERMTIWNRLKYLWPARRRQEEREMREELGSLTAIAGGGQELGNLTLAMEDARATWGWTWLESIFADIRYSFRALAQAARICRGGGALTRSRHRREQRDLQLRRRAAPAASAGKESSGSVGRQQHHARQSF